MSDQIDNDILRLRTYLKYVSAHFTHFTGITYEPVIEFAGRKNQPRVQYVQAEVSTLAHILNCEASWTIVPFQVLDESKLQQVDSLYREFETPEKANKV